MNYLNTVLEMKNQRLVFNYDKRGTFEATQLAKIPEMKKDLIKNKSTIKELGIKKVHLAVDEFMLRWHNISIEGAFRYWFKELRFNKNKADILLLEYVNDCFKQSDGGNLSIDWRGTTEKVQAHTAA